MSNEFDSVKDLEYFSEFKLKYPEVFKEFIREQLGLNTANSVAALEYIRSLMHSEDIQSVVTHLNDSDRTNWRNSIGREKTIKDPAKLMNYIKGEMTRAFIAAKPLVDPEIIELTLKLKTHDVARFCQTFEANAGELLNLLNPTFISKVLDQLPLEKATNLLQSAFDTSTIGQVSLKKNLQTFVSRAHKNSMAVKLLKVLDGIDPKKEKMIYRHVLKVSSTEELVEIAARNCPLEVLWYLPKSSLNEVLQAYPLSKKARFFVSLDADKKKQFIDASSSDGSSARQMIDMEIRQIESDPADLKRCLAQKDVLLLEFLKYFKECTRNNEQVLSDVKLACHQWFTQLSDEDGIPSMAA